MLLPTMTFSDIGLFEPWDLSLTSSKMFVGVSICVASTAFSICPPIWICGSIVRLWTHAITKLSEGALAENWFDRFSVLQCGPMLLQVFRNNCHPSFLDSIPEGDSRRQGNDFSAPVFLQLALLRDFRPMDFHPLTLWGLYRNRPVWYRRQLTRL